MSKDIAEHQGIKYSLQPHGLRSKLLKAFACFVLAFGGALLLAVAPAQAEDVKPKVTPTPTPTLDPTVAPSPTIEPSETESPSSLGPSPAVTVTETVTATVTVTKTKLATITETQNSIETVTVTETQEPVLNSIEETTPEPSETPPPTTSSPSRQASMDTPLIGWGFFLAGTAVLVFLGRGLLRRRSKGAHAIGNDRTQMMPVVSDADDHNVNDYK